MEAGLVEPAVDLNKIRSAVANIDGARKAVDDIFDGSE